MIRLQASADAFMCVAAARRSHSNLASLPSFLSFLWIAFHYSKVREVLLPVFTKFDIMFSRALVSPQTMVVVPKWNLDQALEVIPKFVEVPDFLESDPEALTLYVRYKVNFFAAVPSIIHQIANSPKAAKADFSSVMYVGSGAAYLAPDVAEKFRKTVRLPQAGEGSSIGEGFGLSEAVCSFSIIVSVIAC